MEHTPGQLIETLQRLMDEVNNALYRLQVVHDAVPEFSSRRVLLAEMTHLVPKYPMDLDKVSDVAEWVHQHCDQLHPYRPSKQGTSTTGLYRAYWESGGTLGRTVFAQRLRNLSRDIVQWDLGHGEDRRRWNLRIKDDV